jgi:O-antigen/teichoic acid export membrane protein
VSVSNSAVQASVTIATALAGESYMSMAWGSIAGNITNVALLSFMRPDFVLLVPTSKGLGDVFSFGWKSSTNSLVGELGGSGPDLILGKTLGFEAVAILSRAASLNHMVLGKVMDIVHQVFFPAFAKGIREGKPPAAMYCESMRLITGITVPLVSVLALIAAPLILFLFGSQWHEAAALAMFLCLFHLIRAPVDLAGPSLIAGGHVTPVMRGQFVVQAVRLGIISLSIWLSLREVIYLLFLSNVVEMLVFTRVLNKHYGLSVTRLWSEVLISYKVILPTVFGPLVLLLLSSLDWYGPPTVVHLGLSCLLAGMGYLLGIRILRHPIREELIHQIPALGKLLR